METKLSVKSIPYLVSALLEEVRGPCLNNFKECLSVIVVNETIIEHSVNLMDPKSNQFISLLLINR